MSQQAGGFNWARLSMGSKGLLVTGVLMLITVFLPWQSISGILGVDLGAFGDIPGADDSINAMQVSFLGTLVLILAIALIALEVLLAAGVRISMGTTSPALISAIVGGVTALFALIVFLLSLDGVSWGAFVGLIVALAMAYASYVRFQESKVGAAPPPMA